MGGVGGVLQGGSLGAGFWGWDEGTQGPMSLEAGKQRQVTGVHVEAGARSFCSMEFQAVFGHGLSDLTRELPPPPFGGSGLLCL